MMVKIRRQWNDYRIAKVEYSKLSNLHWDRESGGVQAPAPQYFIHGYVFCDQYEGDLALSCAHQKGLVDNTSIDCYRIGNWNQYSTTMLIVSTFTILSQQENNRYLFIASSLSFAYNWQKLRDCPIEVLNISN
jgi:hypothetical protein